ncbi:ABC transporter permease [Protaetiibacter sp. SSC-01]|uniref:ABC transporter permease n=1 Tax=Protaetiibacter sp. SSC-01 TaxID=2759943 RepID=UPI00223C0083|nr:ABC transporter permease [Protaetiibacter sp. SSC-01]
MTTDASVGGFVRPGDSAGLIDVFRRRYLLSLLIRKEVQVRYRGSVLGWLWSYVKPTAQFIVFFLALGVFLRLNASMDVYPIYLFSGLIAVNFFTEAFSNGTKSIVDNGPLIKKIYLPREMFPVASTIVAFINFLPQLLVTVVVALFVGWHPEPLQLLGVLIGILIIAVLATGLGMLFGAINVSFRDSQNFVELIALVVTWASPVLYPWTTVRDAFPDWLVQVYLMNPVTVAVELFHAGLWFPTTPGTFELPPDLYLRAGVGVLIAVAVLLLGQLVFRRLEGRFAQDL